MGAIAQAISTSGKEHKPPPDASIHHSVFALLQWVDFASVLGHCNLILGKDQKFRDCARRAEHQRPSMKGHAVGLELVAEGQQMLQELPGRLEKAFLLLQCCMLRSCDIFNWLLGLVV